MPYGNPVVSGSVLVRTAIQSIDYVAGVSGWAIFRDGTAEFNNVTVRGTVIAGGGAVRLDSTGVHVVGPVTTYNINVSSGFVANKTVDDGSFTQIASNAVVLNPAEPTPNGFAITQSAIIQTVVSSAGIVDTPHVSLFSPIVNGQNPSANITLYGEASDGGTQRHLSFDGYIDSGFTDSRLHEWLRGENQRFTVSFTLLTSISIPVSFTHAFGVAPIMSANIDTAPASTSGWNVRCIAVTTIGFTLFLFGPPGGAAQTWVNVPVVWTATEPTP